jgi:hypothetical protein
VVKNYKTVTIPQRQDEQLVNLTCDICGKVSFDEENWNNGNSHKNIDTITIERKEGYESKYNLGGNYTKYTLDLCPECFFKYVVEPLEKQNIKFHEEEVDW